MRISKEAQRQERKPKERPQFFARGGRDRVLTCLAVNGPLHVREIARLIGSDSGKTFNMVRHLEDCGLVVKRDEPGFRKIVALNKGLGFLYFQLRDLLLALDAKWPVARDGKAFPFVPKTMLRGPAELTDEMMEQWFQSEPRSRVLLFVAAVGRTNLTDLVRRARVGSLSALYALNHWERQGILRTEVIGIHRVVELDDDFVAIDQLWRVLNALVLRSTTYSELRASAIELKPYLHGRRRG